MPTLWPPSGNVEAKGAMRGRAEDTFPRGGRSALGYHISNYLHIRAFGAGNLSEARGSQSIIVNRASLFISVINACQ